MIVFLFILTVHWIGDFVLQSHWMAVNKSKRWDALGLHVYVYTASLMVAACILGLWIGPVNSPLLASWALLNGVLHFATDAITSRITARLWAQQRTHDFFVIIGLDQLIHALCLGLTLMWIMS